MTPEDRAGVIVQDLFPHRLKAKWVVGRLHVEGLPRGSWEDDIQYYRRVARFYTLQDGEKVRNHFLCESFKFGRKVADLSVDYGLSTSAVRKILHAEGYMKPKRKINEDEKNQIYAMRKAGMKYKDIGAKFGLGPSGAIHICFYKEHEERYNKAIQKRKADRQPLQNHWDFTDTNHTCKEWTPELQAAEFNLFRNMDIS